MSNERYSRQTRVPGIGEDGQLKIAAARAVVLGCGALGTVAANLIVRSGVGQVLIIDRDFVEASNLQRQVLFTEADAMAAQPKALAAQRRLQEINSTIQIEGQVTDVHSGNIESLIEGATVVVDATDNFETRFLLNDACIKHGIPWIYGGAVGVEGMLMTILPGQTPCLRCVFESAPPPGLHPTCETAGILGGVTGVIGSWQATEALKICAGRTETVRAQLLSLDLWNGDVRMWGLDQARLPDCPCCGRHTFQYLDAQVTSHTTTLCGRDAIQISPQPGQQVDLVELARRLTGAAGVSELTQNPYLLRCRLAEAGDSPLELAVFGDGRAIVKGTKDAARARTAYAKYVGA